MERKTIIAAESKRYTYAEAGKLIPTPNGKGKSHRFISEQVKSGKLKAVILGHRTRYIEELDFLEYLQNHRTLDLAHRRRK